MKKYRLIEYNPNIKNVLTERGTFDTKEKVFTELSYRTTNTPNLYYRIEEVEESIIERVKSYEDACEVLGISPIYVRNISWGYATFDTNKSKHLIALLKLETITAALNEGWKPDWEDDKQEKWHVEYNSDAGLLEVDCYNVYSMAFSRLYFKSRELAEYAAKQFAELYKQLLVEKF